MIGLITATTSGIGEKTAEIFAKNGIDLAIHYHSNKDKADKLEKDLKKYKIKTCKVQADLTDIKACKKMIGEIEDQLGDIDILVNNAGMTRDKLLIRLKEEDFTDVIRTNLNTVFNMTSLLARKMMRKKFGRIINISSLVGLHGNIGQANYAASKAGIIGFTKSCAKELARYNITVNAVCPGYIKSPMTDVLEEATKDQVLKEIALRRFGEPEEVGELVYFLASDKAGYITGQSLVIDGGMSI